MTKHKAGKEEPDMERDERFLALPIAVQMEIRRAAAWMAEMAAAASAHEKAAEIEKREQTTPTGRRRGTSRQSLYRRFRAWLKAGRDWRLLEPYRNLRQGHAQPLQSYDLTGKAARAYFARQGLSLAEWAQAHGFTADAVQRALSGTRRNAMSQRVLDALAQEMQSEPEGWHRTVEALRRELSELQDRIRVLEGRLIAAQRKMPHWLGLISG